MLAADSVDDLREEGSVASPASAVAPSGAVRLRFFRLSRPEEATLMMPLLQAYHEESPFGGFAFSERKALQKVLDSLNRGRNGVCFFASFGSRVVGVIDLAVGQPYLSDDGKLATCLGWFVMPDVRKTFLGGRVAALLLREAKAWAKAEGASALLVHGTHGMKVGTLRGVRQIGENYLVRV